MAVTVNCVDLTFAGETLATMFLSALVKTHSLALNSFGLLLSNNPRVNGDHTQNEPKPEDADDEDGNKDDVGDGEEELSSECGEYGKNPNSNKNNPKKGPGGGASGAEQNGEEEEEDEEDGEDTEDEEDDEDEDDDDDDDDEDEDEEDEKDEDEDKEDVEGVENEDEESLQPPKKRKK